MDDFFSLLFVLLLVGAIGYVTGALAKRKGHAFWPWFFSGGIIGLIVLSTLPFANTPDLWESEKNERQERGNRIGKILAVFSCVVAALCVMAG